MLLTFDSDAVEKMLDQTEAAEGQRRGNFEQNYNVAFLRDDLPPERRAVLLAAAEDGFSDEIDPDADIDPAKIPAGIWLVGDQGVYIIPNTTTFDTVAYADQVNPKTLPFDTWWEAKRASFGPDDGCEFLPSAEIRKGLEKGGKLELDVSRDGISIVLKPQPALGEEGPQI